jgi:hypothetical protein
MATTLLLKRFGPALYAADGLAEADVRSLPTDKPLKAVLTRSRSRPQLRLYFAMLQLVVENLEQPISRDVLHEWVKIRCGIVEPVKLKSGAVEMVPGSVAFEAMDQTQFNAFFEHAAELLCEHIIPGLEKPALLQRAREMLGEEAA